MMVEDEVELRVHGSGGVGALQNQAPFVSRPADLARLLAR